MATRALDLRGGDARDAATVDALMAAAFDPRFGEAWTRGQVVGVLAMPGVRLTLAFEDEAPVGFALTRSVIDEVELLLLAVTPTRRRAGIGRALLRAVAADAVSVGIRRMFLEVRAGNDAVRLYTANGFMQTGVRRGYYHGKGGSYDAHSYACPLDPALVASR